MTSDRAESAPRSSFAALPVTTGMPEPGRGTRPRARRVTTMSSERLPTEAAREQMVLRIHRLDGEQLVLDGTAWLAGSSSVIRAR